MSSTFLHLARLSIVSATLGAIPLSASSAQTTSKRAPAAESPTVLLRQFQRMVDSLSRVYDNEDLAWAERRRAGEELDRRVEQFEEQMRIASSEARLGPGTSQPLRLKLDGLARAGAQLGNIIMHAQQSQAAAPRGWIGIVVTGAVMEERIEGGERSLRYWSYPQIASVEPSSPALRAGVQPNDTLIAYNGRDVRQGEISLTQLLRPGSRVVIRVRRDGRVRDLPVIVDTVPTRIRLRYDDRMRELQVPRAMAAAPEVAPYPRVPMSPQAPRPVTSVNSFRPPVAPVAPRAPVMFSFTSGGVAGAQLVTITEGLGRTLGTKSGVLVTSVAPGVPAHESGLRDGDVIVAADGDVVRSVSQVREIVARAAENGERAVELDIRREKRPRKLILRW
jgi:C-terminal processing protease CtpA/Prc